MRMTITNNGAQPFSTDVPNTFGNQIRILIDPADTATVLNVDPFFINQNQLLRELVAAGQLAVSFAADANDLVSLSSSGDSVKVSAADTTAAFLDTKITAGTNISLAILNPGANESLEISATGGVPATRNLTAGAGMVGGGDLSADRTFDVVANADGSIVVNADDIQVGVLASDAQHGNLGGGSLHAVATGAVAGFMSAADKTRHDAHLNPIDTTNPHAVTAAQVGAPPDSRNLTAGAGLVGGGDLTADRTFDVVANADGSIVVNANDIQVGVLATDAQHGTRGGGTLHAVATGAVAGFMSAADKTKLDTYPASFPFSHTLLSDLTPGDGGHSELFLLTGRTPAQTAIFGSTIGATGILQGSTAGATRGLIQMNSPVVFDDVTDGNSLSPYSVQDNSTNSFTAAFIGGTYADQRQIDFNSALFIYETLRGSPNIQSLVNPAFGAFTLFNALPVLNAGSGATHNNLQALVLNAGPSFRNAFSGTRTAPSAIAVNFAPVVNPAVLGATQTVTTITGLSLNPRWNTVAGSTANLGTIRGLHAQNPQQALFGSSAGVETMTAYYAVDVENVGLGTAPVRALRSALTAATFRLMIENTGGASSEFGSGIIHVNDTTPIQFGGGINTMDTSLFWNNANSTFDMFLAANSDSIRFSNPASGVHTIQSSAAAGDLRLGYDTGHFGSTGAIGNQHWNFTLNARTMGVAGEYAGVLLTPAANLTVPFANSVVNAWVINSLGVTLSGPGTVTDHGVLTVGGNPNQGTTNRFGIRILSNPTGGSGVNAALWITAGRARFDGIVDINNADALGGGGTATLGTVGGSGPTATAQSQWLQIEIAGTNHWIPVWV